MFLSAIVSGIYGFDSASSPLLLSSIITFLFGIFPLIFVRGGKDINTREGLAILMAAWLLSCIFGMLPYILWGGEFSVVNAWFESTSGITTTGATILNDIEALPHGLLFWRSSSHYLGGLGVVVFMMMILPSFGSVRFRMSKMEMADVSKDNYHYVSDKFIRVVVTVYLGLTVSAILALVLAGMPLFDAVNHAFSVCAAGGFSSKNLSIAAFDSRVIEGLTMIFMYLASIHFGLVYMAFATRSFKPLNNPILKFYTFGLLLFTVLLALILKPGGYEATWGDALWHSAFQVLCIGSSTGFAIVDNASWPLSARVITLFIGIIGGMAGSTAGGIKSDRFVMLIKTIARQVRLALHPSEVSSIRIGKSTVREEDLMPQLLYVSLFTILLALSVFLSLLYGVNTHSAFAASVSTLTNVGPALEELGTMGSYNSVPDAAKILYSMNMFFGRIEIYPVLAVISMLFTWRKR
jgi:trk system potassium uptake protein TrkH